MEHAANSGRERQRGAGRRVSASEMREIDRLAQEEYNIPGIVLMENAGCASAWEILKEHKKGKAAVFCGRGNNGGDGFVCARYLKKGGINVRVFLLSSPSEVKNEEPRVNLKILRLMNLEVEELPGKQDVEKISCRFECDFVVDAIFGIGFKGLLPEVPRAAVRLINKSRRPVYALDVPSGLDATQGTVNGPCVRAYKTITFGLPKTGLFRRQARRYVGQLVVKDIGLPAALLN